MIPGGISNTAAGSASLAAGTRALANHAGAFVWADSTDINFASTAANQFAVRAGGGIWFTSAVGDMFRMLPHSTSPNIIGGYLGNTISIGVAGATIAGGGISTGFNRVTDQHGTIGGGAGNVAGNDTGTTIDAIYATISGGWLNAATASYASIGGGRDHRALSTWSTIGGGYQNTIHASGSAGTIGGGMSNVVENQASTIAGGESNAAAGARSTVGGGKNNTATGGYATVAGGEKNIASHLHATIGGGSQNLSQAQYATISGGYTNTIGSAATAATIGGGQGNAATGTFSTVGGGQGNTAGTFGTTVSGGYSNMASTQYASIGGGHSNVASGLYAAIAGGLQNTASGSWSIIPGGYNNAATANYTFAAGSRAKANHIGTFIWADSTDADIASTAANQFIVRASGGIWLGTTSAPNFPAGRFLNTSTGAYLSSGGTWTNSSDRALKDNFTAVDGKEILARLSKVPILGWNYKAEDASIRHIGPVAQDFYAAFGVGEDDTHISTIDASGVALAAIQGLYTIVVEKDAQIAAQQAQIDDLESRLAALESLVAQLAAKGEGR
jgi:hypothetical protein